MFKVWKRADNPPPPPENLIKTTLRNSILLHVLTISNGIVNLPEYILTNSHFQLDKNDIVIEY